MTATINAHIVQSAKTTVNSKWRKRFIYSVCRRKKEFILQVLRI